MRRRLHIEPIPSEMMRFIVESQRNGVPPYLVDLAGLDGNGICACENFEHRIYPLVKAQIKLPWKQRVPICCIHLIDAREFFMQEIIHGLMDKIAKESEVPRLFGAGEPPEIKRESANGFFQRFFHWREKTEEK